MSSFCIESAHFFLCIYVSYPIMFHGRIIRWWSVSPQRHHLVAGSSDFMISFRRCQCSYTNTTYIHFVSFCQNVHIHLWGKHKDNNTLYIYYTIISIHSLHIFSTHSFFHTTILYHNSYTISFRFDHPRLGVETSFDERNERNAPLDPRRCSASPPRSADSARTAAAGRRPHRTRPGVRILCESREIQRKYETSMDIRDTVCIFVRDFLLKKKSHSDPFDMFHSSGLVDDKIWSHIWNLWKLTAHLTTWSSWSSWSRHGISHLLLICRLFQFIFLLLRHRMTTGMALTSCVGMSFSIKPLCKISKSLQLGMNHQQISIEI